MITIISGTNRENSATLKVAKQYAELLEELNESVQILDLKRLTGNIVTPDMYTIEMRDQLYTELQEQYLVKVDKLVILAPEYNGGIPGVLKLFIDACSIVKQEESFFGKKVALVGIASGRAGNLRGLDYLTNVLNYLKVNILPNKIPISSIHLLMEDDQLTNQQILDALKQQALELTKF